MYFSYLSGAIQFSARLDLRRIEPNAEDITRIYQLQWNSKTTYQQLLRLISLDVEANLSSNTNQGKEIYDGCNHSTNISIV
ncbi:MAG TPA: hypothetical protein DCL61_10180 [Cyanobacteria bacterium UBA12227]|nr:hypothetical protein [Cyanobacteria bacterium UBA12227]HAX85275.1 hypothetical protein [Cyanobacteria bacterium UBA11370]HBY79001.1 hypothetical protein [Cyanobacteria bacterium UBA11148]